MTTLATAFKITAYVLYATFIVSYVMAAFAERRSIGACFRWQAKGSAALYAGFLLQLISSSTK